MRNRTGNNYLHFSVVIELQGHYLHLPQGVVLTQRQRQSGDRQSLWVRYGSCRGARRGVHFAPGLREAARGIESEVDPHRQRDVVLAAVFVFLQLTDTDIDKKQVKRKSEQT